jgi:hypothetical protein
MQSRTIGFLFVHNIQKANKTGAKIAKIHLPARISENNFKKGAGAVPAPTDFICFRKGCCATN